MMMKRQDFLKRLLGGGALLTVTHVPALPEPVPIHTCAVRGFAYHRGPQVLHRLRVGDPLKLVREPDNAFDENAVAVHWNGEQLGYLPREDNAMLAVMLDRGIALHAHLSAVVREAPLWGCCEVTVGLTR